MTLRWAPTLLLVLAASPVRADVLRLTEVEERAVAHGATARGATARIAEADAALEASRAARRPTFALSSNVDVAPGGHLVEIEAIDGQRFLVEGAREITQSGAFTPQ